MKYRKLIVSIIIVVISAIFINHHFRLFAINIGVGNAEPNLRLMTFNVDFEKYCQEGDGRLNELLTEVHNINPDILCLQEISQENYQWMAESLDSLFGYCETFGNKEEVLRYYIYSKKPLRNFKRHKCIGDIDTTGFSSLDYKELNQITRQMPLYSAEIEVQPDRWMTVFSCHLRSSAYSTARREMDKDASWFEGIPHYYRNYCIGKRIRDYEADNVRRYVDAAQAENKPVIVAGDFNDWGGSYCMNIIEGNTLKDAWWEGGNGFGFTYKGWHLRL